MDQTVGSRPVGAGERTIMALFDERAEAESARDELERGGIPRSSMALHPAPHDASSADQDDAAAWWEAIKRLFVPHDDAHTYHEGIRRGGFVLVVPVGDAKNDWAIDVVESWGAVDIDARAEQWRSQGWTPGESVDAATRDTGDDTRIPIAREDLRLAERKETSDPVRVRAYTIHRAVSGRGR
jgi:hypothetical protein